MIPKVSVIVPVYKTEIYLEQCLNSLVNQTLEEIEIIVVNDQSPDNSQEIINNFVKLYPGKIISLEKKKNEGLGFARNDGIKIAKGEYIGFVDSDDWVDREMFDTLYNVALQGNDIIMCDLMAVKENGQSNHAVKGFRGPKFDFRYAVMYATDPAFACNKLIKRSLCKNHKFTNDWYEDVATIPIWMSYAKSISYVELPLYYYRKRSGSVTNSNDIKTLDIRKAWKRILKHANPKYREEIVFSIALNIGIFVNFKPKYAKKFFRFAKKYKRIIKKNRYYKKAVKNNKIKDLFKKV